MFAQLTFSFLWCSRKFQANQSPDDSISSVTLLQQRASLWALDLISLSIFTLFKMRAKLPLNWPVPLMASLSLMEMTSTDLQKKLIEHLCFFSIPLVTPPQDRLKVLHPNPREEGVVIWMAETLCVGKTIEEMQVAARECRVSLSGLGLSYGR